VSRLGQSFLEAFGIKHPIIQAPMAGVTTPEFVAASSESGILGSIGAGYLSAAETRQFIQKVKKLTNRPFAVNLFIPEENDLSENQLHQANQALQPYRDQLGVPTHNRSFAKSEFDLQVQVCLEEDVKICSFTFGLPNEKTIQSLKVHEIFLVGTATTVEEAKLAEKMGMDAVVIQGCEAGGHRGSFHGELQLIPLHELLKKTFSQVQIPMIAAGGIADRSRMDAALALGAEAVQIGTALLASNESGAHPVYKEAVLNATPNSTDFTKAFTGKMARGIRNRLMIEMENQSIAPYPFQHELTKAIRTEAARQGVSDYMSLWAGVNVHESTSGDLKEIIGRFL
jgi:nitronate monooxygenase